ncbi:MAG: hypothetical protein JW795_21035 [Chitinivibrionales bacterium]|nr:hypothetical protein [Chitinivibrionales bacterium]
MNRKTLLGAIVGCGITAVVALELSGSCSDADASPGKREEAPVLSQTCNMDSLFREVRELSREVRHLKSRLAKQETAQTLKCEPPATSQDANETELSESASLLSGLSVQEHRIASYSFAFNEEQRDGPAASEFEEKITQVVDESGNRLIETVDCRTTLCRLEIRHDNLSGVNQSTDSLLDLMAQYGRFQYLSEDGEKTIAFVGMPNHPLPQLDVDDLELDDEKYL